jgi:uncharacterized membrane protein YbaN (DUF454 family)
MKSKMLVICGSIALALGIAGIFLPVLPTTPFLLLAATCYFHGSRRMYSWLMNHKRLGPYIRSFREEKSIPLRAKIVSVAMVWLTLLYCAAFITSHILLRILFVALAAGITWHILSFKTRKQ